VASANRLTPERDRIRATPYARRLARERGVVLSRLTGSGPDGRITGADVTGFVQPPAARATTTARASAAALAATVDLTAARDLLKHFSQVAPGIELIDVCLKAAVSALRAAPDFAGDGAGIALRAGQDTQHLPGIERLTLGAIAELRRKPAETTDARPSLTIAWIARAGVRPMAMPLAANGGAVLTIATDANASSAECLLSYDGERIDGTAAADFLLAFKAGMEIPLRLIA
jgi:pyruvate dehydrogenase E2 component (dihydrolipoamide acetyltransferase)